MRNLKLTLVIGAIVAALTACGGGGDNGGVDNSAMTLSVTPSGDQNMAPNSTMKLSMNSSVRRSSSTDTNAVSSMSWTVTPLNGETVNPVLSDATCAGINISGASGGCSTIISVPQNVTTGKWNVIATAKATNGTQRSENFTLSVDNSVYNLSAGNAQVVTASTKGTFTPVTLTGNLSGNNGGKILTVAWTQTSGPDTAVLANANTLTPSFTPTAIGKYVFNLQVTIDNITLNSVTTVDTQPPSN